MDRAMGKDRRELLKACTGLMTGVLILSGPLAPFATAGIHTWEIHFRIFTSSQANTLLSVLRTVLPHDKLDDLAYAQVIHALDEQSRGDAAFASMLAKGLELLGGSFAAKPEGERVEELRTIERSGFFQAVRLKGVQVLYSTPAAYAYFGYEGEAFSKGGYLHRGFDDLHWLPEVSPEDSGPLPGGG